MPKNAEPSEQITVTRPDGPPFVFPGRLLASASGEHFQCLDGNSCVDWFEIEVYAHDIPAEADQDTYISPFDDLRDEEHLPHDLENEATRVVVVTYKSSFDQTKYRDVTLGFNDLPGELLVDFDIPFAFKLRDDKELLARLKRQFESLASKVLDEM